MLEMRFPISLSPPLSGIAFIKNRREASHLLAFPIGEGGPRQRRSGAFVNRRLETLLPALFHTACALSAPSGHLPLEGKADDTGIPSSKMQQSRPCEPIHSPASSSRAQPRDLSCTAAICTHAPSLKRRLGASFFAFPSPTVYRSAKGSLHFGPHDTQERRIVSHPFSYRCVELCLSETLYPAPSARAVWPHRKAP